MSAVTRAVVNAVRRLYPEALADKSWDNTGLLLEAPPRQDIKTKSNKHSVLLTIDLTRAVANEAIGAAVTTIVAYHPIIFKPLTALTLSNSQTESILRLAQAGISVYCPHTAVDATIGGVNDWLADGISGGHKHEASREVIVPVSRVEGHDGAGMGRIITLKKPTELMTLVDRVKHYLGMNHVMVASTQKHSCGTPISKIGLCAGSGGSMFKTLQVDLFFTGELSHHEALAANERGISVISCFHTNTERGFLNAVMKPKLTEVLAFEWDKIRAEYDDIEGEGFEVLVSEADRDPYIII